MRTLTLIALALLTTTLTVGCVLPDNPPVEQAPPLGITVTPADSVLPVGSEIQLTALAFYEDGSTADITASVRWSVMSGADCINLSDDSDNEGRVRGLRSGTASVRAVLDTLYSDPVPVLVTDAQIVGLSVTPNRLELASGESEWLSAMAEFSDGTRGDFSGGVRWVVGDKDIAEVATDGRVTALSEGVTHVTAEYEYLASTPATVDVLGFDDEPLGDDDDDDDSPVGDDDDDDDTPAGDDDDDDDDPGYTGMPNLEITYFEAFVDYDIDTTYFWIDVTNSGTAPAYGFWVDLWIDPWFDPDVGDEGDAWVEIEELLPGETIYADFEAADSPWFGWGSFAIVDTTEDVDETHETDNVAGPLDVS